VTDPLVSVIIDNYNYARFLPDAIDSALDQTYPHVEVVVVDDGSTDDSLEVIAKYGDRVRCLSRVNGGQASAMNAGMEVATGDFIVMLDSDDTMFPDVLTRCMEQFASQPELVRIQWRLRVVDEDNCWLGRVIPPEKDPLLTGDQSRFVARHHLFRAPPASGNIYRASTLRQVPAVPEQLFRQYVDRWWSELTALLGPISALAEVGGTYRIHTSNHSTSLGREAEYFRSRIELTAYSHQAGRALAHDLGRPAADWYAPKVDDSWDAALFGWELSLHKLTAEPLQGRGLLALSARALACTARQHGLSLRTRVSRLCWLAVLTTTPAGSRAAARAVAWRYDRES
jgi:glycosyltransferase involved in cell wall biosynthesis